MRLAREDKGFETGPGEVQREEVGGSCRSARIRCSCPKAPRCLRVRSSQAHRTLLPVQLALKANCCCGCCRCTVPPAAVRTTSEPSGCRSEPRPGRGDPPLQVTPPEWRGGREESTGQHGADCRTELFIF